MTVILKDIDANKRKSNDYGSKDVEMYTISKYRDIAKKCISLFAGSPMSVSMIKNEDAISHVAEHVMWGHVRWKEDGGRTLKSYLNQCAIWAIKVWKTKLYKSDSIRSLNYPAMSDGDNETQQYEITADKSAKQPYEILFDDVSMEAKKIISSSCLTQLQGECLYQRYIEGKKLRQIAETLSVSRQAVNQHIKKAIAKLRKSHGVCE